MRRRSRARVRMMSSSFCTVAAATGASTQAPFWLTWREAATRSASARRSWSRIETVSLTRSLGDLGLEYQSVMITPAVGVGLEQRGEGHGVERGAPQIGVDSDGRQSATARAGSASRGCARSRRSATARTRSAAAVVCRRGIGNPWTENTGVSRRYRWSSPSRKHVPRPGRICVESATERHRIDSSHGTFRLRLTISIL